MRAFGCDIGNGFAFVSVLDEASGKPFIALPAKWSMEGMPTDVLVKADGTIVTGRRLARLGGGGSACRALKRSLSNYQHKEGGYVDPLEVYAHIAQTALNASFNRLKDCGYNPPHDVVLTYPASFIDSPRTVEDVRDAVSRVMAPDGKPYVVCGTLPEPTAIALDFLVEHGKKGSQESCVAIYDLGHGTFDTALVSSRMVDGKQAWTVHDYGCLGNIGGIDFDDALVGILKRKIYEQDGRSTFNNADEMRLLEEAMYMKYVLSEEISCESFLTLSDGSSYVVDVYRKEFERKIYDLVRYTISELDRILEEAGQRGLRLTHVVLSGGSSQVPLVGRMVGDLVVKRFAGKVQSILYNPVEAVSFGAARYASLLERVLEPESTSSAGLNASPLERMRQLYEPMFVGNMDTCSNRFTLEASRAMGVIDESSKCLNILIPEGSSLPTTSCEFVYVPSGAHISLVVGRANSVGVRQTLLPMGEYRQVIRLHSDGAHVGEHYVATLRVDRVGLVSITLVGSSGHQLKME